MDIKCVICGEPYSAWGVNHGDMMAWETDLFRKGAGCPSCEGVRPAEKFVPQSLEDLENGDEDPMDRIIAYENAENGNIPAWEKPKDEVLHECDGCGVQLIRAVSQEVYDGNKREKVYEWIMPHNAPGARWYHSHRFDRIDAADYIEGGAEEFNWHPWDDDRSACPHCQKLCDTCGEAVISDIDGLKPDDCEDPGYSFMDPSSFSHSECYDCHLNHCSECECNPCECEDDEENDDEEEDA